MDLQTLFDQSVSYTLGGLAKYGYVTRNDLACRELRGATATPRAYFPDRSYVGAVYDGRNELVRSTLRFNERDIFPVDPAQLDDIANLSAVTSGDSYAWYGGILFPILGHFYFESLSRLWPLLWRRPSVEARLPIYFHSWPGLDLPHFLANPLYQATLQAFGIEPQDIRIIDRPTRFETLVVADTASAYHLNLDERMQSVFDQIATSILHRFALPAAAGAGRRVYLSRSGWADNRRILNEEAIDAQLARRGFEVVHTQTMSPPELIDMFRATDVLVATDGSHAHLAAFCRPGIRVVMLDTRPVPTQFAIAKLRAFAAFHVPLFETPLYRFEVGITDPDLLGSLIDRATS